MTKEQMIHISMVNSYNVITNRATVQQVTNSGIGVFCHSPEEKDGMESIKFMITYFHTLMDTKRVKNILRMNLRFHLTPYTVQMPNSM